MVATPIGNLEDITRRAARILAEVDRIACEDTRTTRSLCTQLGIRGELLRHDAHSAARSTPAILGMLSEGLAVALVTDAGTPGVSDPGEELVTAVRDAGHPVIPIPGASALTAALSACGLPSSRFTFHGFLPKKAGARRRVLTDLEPGTHVWFCPARDLAVVLGGIDEVLPEADVVVARELTKLHETFYRGTPGALRASLGAHDLLGEAVIVLHRRAAEEAPDEVLHLALARELAAGAHLKEAADRVAVDHGVSKRRVYQLGLAARALPRIER